MQSRPESCADVRALLPLFVGSDLEPEEMKATHAHLAECAACSEALERAEAAREALIEECRQSAARSDEEVDLWPALREQLRAEGLVRPVAVTADSGSTSVASGSLEASNTAAASNTDERELAASPLGSAGTETFGSIDAAAGSIDAVASGRGPRPLGRLWVGAFSSAAAVVFALFLARSLGPLAPAREPAGATPTIARTQPVSSPLGGLGSPDTTGSIGDVASATGSGLTAPGASRDGSRPSAVGANLDASNGSMDRAPFSTVSRSRVFGSPQRPADNSSIAAAGNGGFVGPLMPGPLATRTLPVGRPTPSITSPDAQPGDRLRHATPEDEHLIERARYYQFYELAPIGQNAANSSLPGSRRRVR